MLAQCGAATCPPALLQGRRRGSASDQPVIRTYCRFRETGTCRAPVGSRTVERLPATNWQGVAAMWRGLRRHWMLGQLRRTRVFRRHGLAAVAVAAALAMAAAGCAVGSSGTSGHTPTAGGTVTYALPANNTPNYIFPFSPGQYFTVVNSSNLQYLMYRPLYWFGAKGLPYLNEELSLAEPPSDKDHVVTIKLKPGYRWSNGDLITAQDILFWMHMMKAVVKLSTSTVNWGGYVPGYFPDNVTNIRAIGTDEVQMT